MLQSEPSSLPCCQWQEPPPSHLLFQSCWLESLLILSWLLLPRPLHWCHSIRFHWLHYATSHLWSSCKLLQMMQTKTHPSLLDLPVVVFPPPWSQVRRGQDCHWLIYFTDCFKIAALSQPSHIPWLHSHWSLILPFQPESSSTVLGSHSQGCHRSLVLYCVSCSSGTPWDN